MVYAGLAGALLGLAAAIHAIYADQLSYGKRALLALVGLALYIISVWRL
jgi:hypothetical protein